MTDNPITRFDELIGHVAEMHRRTNNLTAAIRYFWSDWSTMIGRGAPFRAIDAAYELGVKKASIDKAHYVIRREHSHPPVENNTPRFTADSGSASARGPITHDSAPDPQSGDELDEDGNIVRYAGRWKYTYMHETRSWKSEYL